MRFIEVEKFHSPGLAPVYDQSGGYHINLDGIAVYAQRFDKAFGFYCNRAAVLDKEKYYHIDLQGNRTYLDSYDWVGNYQENKCVVRKGNKFFHIGLEGNKIYSEEYDYVGDFKDGFQEGYGTYYWPDGQIYQGSWKQNKRHGKGKDNYASGDSYDGDWVNGKYEGQGLYTYKDGSTFKICSDKIPDRLNTRHRDQIRSPEKELLAERRDRVDLPCKVSNLQMSVSVSHLCSSK
jgi:hypothetical protein